MFALDSDLLGSGDLDTALDEYASLTAVLRLAKVPRAETVAGFLLGEFGSIASVLAAGSDRLAAVLDERVAALIEAMRNAMLAALRPRKCAPPVSVVESTNRLLVYLQTKIAYSPVEEVHVLYLDRNLAVLREEMLARGDRDQVSLSSREVVRRALELRAGAVLLAHNHPSGSLKPSEGDLRATHQLIKSAALFGIIVVDHVIVTREGVVSLSAEGLM